MPASFVILVLFNLSFLVNGIYPFFSHIVCLVLILRFYFLGYAVEFIKIFLPLGTFFFFLIHLYHLKA